MNEKAKEIMVYFNSGNKARLPVEDTILTNRPDVALADAEAGLYVVNWANVCFLRAFEERERTEEDE